ncbi:MAG: DNA recombination protein RmuC [Deltaproteobacteria bacterium]|nr:DNA recombination protein RmuC [Deltaproteobacteria bacterium]
MEHVITWLPELTALVVGFLAGLAVALLIARLHSKTARQLAEDIFKETESERRAGMEIVMSEMKASFGSLSLDALGKSTEEFLKLARSHLGAERDMTARELQEKKTQIDDQFARMVRELEKVSTLVGNLEKDRVEKFGDLSRQLKTACQQTEALAHATDSLRQALSGTRTRGQWGERMAEDVLRTAGFIEHVNFVKQKALKGVGTRPDFTFLLPQGLKLNMDVKFPLDNYLRLLEAPSDVERTKYQNDFIRDVRNRMREVTTRDYINPEERTLDYVLLFIPNEHVYAFIHEQDRSLLDAGMQKKVVLCSPLTLFAILAVIRRAVDNFALEQTSAEILSLLEAFNKQWAAFNDKLDMVGKRIDDARKEYEALTTTRRRQLEKPLRRIEELRARRETPPGAEAQ